MKKIIFIFLILIFTLISCGNKNKVQIDNNLNQQISIVASIPPIASISKYIGGDKIQVSSLIQPGFSPHTFDLKPSDLININNADLIISTGLSIDAFLEKNIKTKNTLILKNHVTLIKGDNDSHENINTPDHEEIFYDSHIWLSLDNGNKIAQSIKDKLIILNPENEGNYIDNYEKFLVKSDEVKNNFLDKINNRSQNNFIVYHEAYSYMFHEFSINQDDILHIQEDEGRELSVSEMKNIIDTIQTNNIKILFREPQFENKLIKNISKKYNLKVLNLDPLGTTIDKKGYFENMENNLNNLLEIYE